MTAVFIRWFVFVESGSRGPSKDNVKNLFSLIPGVVHLPEDSYFTHTLHLFSYIVLKNFNVMTSFLCILQPRTVFRGFGL